VLRTVMSLPGAKIGALLAVAAPILTPPAKHATRIHAALASSPVAVEIEAYPLAEWAWRHMVSFIHAAVTLVVAEAMEALGIPYAIGGSFSSAT
jgi:cell wall-associated NlpC family hydrolase